MKQIIKQEALMFQMLIKLIMKVIKLDNQIKKLSIVNHLL
jgi:glutathionylspermidine synthase